MSEEVMWPSAFTSLRKFCGSAFWPFVHLRLMVITLIDDPIAVDVPQKQARPTEAESKTLP
jgi:hypothetical protein